jgi:hypothetical protein
MEKEKLWRFCWRMEPISMKKKFELSLLEKQFLMREITIEKERVKVRVYESERVFV